MLAGADQRLCGAFDVIEQASMAQTPEALDAIMAKAFAAFGIQYFSVDQMRDGAGQLVGVHHFGNWPDDWGAHYLEQQHYNHDRVVRHAILNPSPVHWLNAQSDRDMARNEKRLFGEAREFGLKDGFITPVHQIDGNVASVSLTSAERLELSPADQAALRLLSLYYCMFGLRLKHTCGNRVKLTKRELQCLQWVRAGKSSWEISELLGMSERTVNFHVQNACKRLNVKTRHQAIIEAIMQGQISL
jgi:DNA-binding CsgD family transcriptional regulator